MLEVVGKNRHACVIPIKKQSLGSAFFYLITKINLSVEFLH